MGTLQGTAFPLPPPRTVERKERQRRACAFTHIPYRRDSVPFPGRLTKCTMCYKKYVPELLFSTCELPEGAAIVGRGEIIEARVCRVKKKEKGAGRGMGPRTRAGQVEARGSQ
jgi:hypothetical protein